MRDQHESLRALQDWYAAQCDGQWDPLSGIRIGTLDSPGWSLRIDLSSTGLAGRPFTEVKVQGDDDDDWCHCRIQSEVFEAFCGPDHLVDVIAIFLAWAVAAARNAAH
ncbi:immunity 53 family protein [Bradyrhizobium sp. HKCCYLR20261]|uniref:immunity 53 family protein n=1 Tax=Bradyrhizobium sp. HKCCYLR20261 TaxID=3420760 RepID=UPI003EBF8240